MIKIRSPIRPRSLLGAALVAVVAGTLGGVARAESYPERPITLVVGFSPGGAADTVARQLAEELSKQLGQRVNVDNRSGASGNIATSAVLSSPADGYTLLFSAVNLATNPWLSGVKYDTKTDLVMVSQITSVPVVMLVSGNSNFRQPVDLVRSAHKTEGGLKAGSGGIGTSSHLALELFSRSLNVPVIHVPYRGGAPANQALLAREVDLMFDLMSGGLKQMVDSGRMRALAVMQDKRVSALPDVKSAAELGMPPETYVRSWQGIAVKAGTPKAVVDKLHKAVVAAAASSSFSTRVGDQLGYTVVTSKQPDDFQKFYLAELARWGSLIKTANIKPE
ncbi:Bug family tripartite tricarboxylate transporter substrate binding protein [Roseateles violae]|uniref:Tripartite tricarboxylate transporter substrate binding protein n=1 Tax=Roseateles violae TaxID=3058042 RepID=A0ABT8DT21_9BURK|nr:tripartite tricarboxylate transporter substrate binding protein [Pelomonas sp. PFR6]MDN3921461.1 tripartite tricarboxylate transporter substrate binding protein [Pelomonas sp. PFR6]